MNTVEGDRAAAAARSAAGLAPVDGAVSDPCPPTLEAALGRLAAVRPATYARTRNHLEGAVTGLSPFLTHGFLTLPGVRDAVRARHPLPDDHKLVFELAWREYFRHVWRHEGDGIFESLHAGPLPDAAYDRALPEDVRHACSGVPAVDQAVRTLYASGTPHNHARMWLASYLVHVRKVHWRTGADWMYGHLLDGDLASNHLSWQWVAGTGSAKPYLFNAGNVARHAPVHWHSAGTAVDRSYNELDRLARERRSCPEPSRPRVPTAEPPCTPEPPPRWRSRLARADPAALRGCEVWLMHLWSLAGPPPSLPAGTRVVAVLDAAFHARWPWSARRWDFVAARLTETATLCWWDEPGALLSALAAARRVRGVDDPHLDPRLRALGLEPAPRLFADPARRCRSFSAFWTEVRRRG